MHIRPLKEKLGTATYFACAKTNSAGATNYTYDAFGSLIKVVLPDNTVLEYIIDSAGRRVAKKVNGVITKAWLYEGSLRPVAELDASGNVLSRFVYATNVNVPEYVIKAGVTYRIVTDQLGSVRMVVNAGTGAVVQEMKYDEFGVVTQDTNPGFTPFGFAGGLYDADTKIVRFGARDYDAETGRWTAKDPIGFNGGDTNLYGYVMADPVNGVDPEGLHEVFFNGKTLSVYDDAGNKIAEYKATSGSPGYMFAFLQSYKNKGPIPEGKYSFDPMDFSHTNFVRNIRDWGTWRVTLTPDPSTETYGRFGFFIHGGKYPGSAGCIDIGNKDVDFYDLLKTHKGKVALTVKYPEERKPLND